MFSMLSKPTLPTLRFTQHPTQCVLRAISPERKVFEKEVCKIMFTVNLQHMMRRRRKYTKGNVISQGITGTNSFRKGCTPKIYTERCWQTHRPKLDLNSGLECMDSYIYFAFCSLRLVRRDRVQRLDGSQGSLIREGEVITTKNGSAIP
jgi:hypothetical protein